MNGAQLVALILALLAHGDAGTAWIRAALHFDKGEAQRTEPAARFAIELLALARCEPATVLDGRISGDPWLSARAHARIERIRLGRVQPAWTKKLRWTAPPAATGDLIRWPAEKERWSDEKPIPVVPRPLCGERAAAAPSHEVYAIERLLSVLPRDAPTRPVLALEAASLYARLEDWDSVERMVAESDGAGLEGAEAREWALLHAVVAARHDRDTVADWLRARDEQHPNALVDAYLIASGLRKGDADGARIAWSLAEARAGESDWFATRAAVAAFRLEDEKAFFAAARRVLAKRGAAEVRQNPLLREVADLAFARLATHPFGDEVIELAESLGPPRELHDRIDAAAEAALRTARAPFALAAWRWLEANSKNAFVLPRYHARQVVATLAGGDAKAFLAGYLELVDRALGQNARRRRPLEWDRQLLFVTRDALPLVTAPSDPKLLPAMVQALQRYLRAAGKLRSYPELTDLYRVMSTQLPLSSGARPYAEKLGSSRVPLLLGEVQVPKEVAVARPPADLTLPRLEGARSLLCLPEGPRCQRWAGPEVTP